MAFHARAPEDFGDRATAAWWMRSRESYRNNTVYTAEIRKLHRAGVSKSEIARRLQVGRTSLRRILAGYSSQK